MLLLLSLTCIKAGSLEAQAALEAPLAHQRAEAEAELLPEELLEACRSRLDEGGQTASLIRALALVGRERESADLPRVLRYLDDLDSAIADAAMSALRAYGTRGLQALREIEEGRVARVVREQAVERLLLDHILESSRRDNAINPFRLPFADRFAELYSVPEDVDALCLKLLRETRSEIRDDIAGQRMYYGVQPSQFMQLGGLAVAALAANKPDLLHEEFAEIASAEPPQQQYYGWQQRSPVTTELAIFFARRGNTMLADRFISDLEAGMRWGNQAQFARMHMQIAALETAALGEHGQALQRVNDNVANLAGDVVALAQAHFLRARLLMQLGDRGTALRALEDSMEAGSHVMVALLVDDNFESLRGDPRFRTILRYCELAQRRLHPSQRPWRPGTDAGGD